ncbi:MAG: homocysteine S-methyltransferase family protein [Clostridia bacterium]|nr:homocysteine S-methyltransferase family protein [Clostridia bacterium]
MIFILDGAFGTEIWAKTDDKLPVWRYNIEKPELVKEIHRSYIDAGSDIIYTNTFGANGPTVKRSPYSVKEVVEAGVRIAREAVEGTGVKTALSIGPLSELLEPYGDLEEDEATEIYEEQIGAGMETEGAPDIIVLETFMDIEMLKVAAAVANKYEAKLFCSMSFEQSGRTMMGNSVDDMINGLAGLRVDAIGLNCSLGPDKALPIISEFCEKSSVPVLFKPNAGLPTDTVADADNFANDVCKAIGYGVKYAGGCCGTNPGYIRKLIEKVK